MPEGDTIFRTAQALHQALAGRTVTRFERRVPVKTHVRLDLPLEGRTVDSVTAHGKWILMRFSGDVILVTHLRMNGSWHVYRPQQRLRKPDTALRLLIETDGSVAVAYNLTVAEFHSERTLARHPILASLGPDLASSRFDPEEAFRRIRALPAMEIGSVLLNQHALAGLGNVFKSEVLFACGVSPFCQVARLSADDIHRIVETAERLLKLNAPSFDAASPTAWSVSRGGFRRTTGSLDPRARLWVYNRKGQPCRRCGAPIAYHQQGPEARATYWCPRCQRGAAPARA